VPRIVLIAPDKHMYLQGKAIQQELQLFTEMDIYLANERRAVKLAHSLDNRDVDVIISRGGTAQMILDSQVRIPIVETPVTTEDLIRLFHEAQRLTGLQHPKVLISVYNNWLEGAKALADIMGIDLTVLPRKSMTDMQSHLLQVSQLRPTDYDLVIAGTRISVAAAQHGIKTLRPHTGSLALRTAFREAQRVALGRKIEKEQAQRFKALVEYSTEGIISINQEKIIQVFNPTAERLLNRSAKEMLGQRLDACLDLINIETCLNHGQESLGNTAQTGNIWISYNIAPIIVDDVINGAIITFQDITRIQEMEARIRKEVVSKKFVAKYTFSDILGTSKEILESKRIAREMAKVDASILIAGESGTGKELFAQSIHNSSRRKNGPFIALNCAALPPTLLESELFGYVEGAFTGATKKGKPGLFEMAHRGTIFLDEISEMDKYGQSRLLRVLQEKQVMRLGDDKNIPVDVRIIAATNKNLLELIGEGHFRQDLFYRLKVLTLNLPSLSNRTGDISCLAKHFTERYNQQHGKHVVITPATYDYLTRHVWPGNIRELMYFIERLIVIASEKTITPAVVEKYWEDRSRHKAPSAASTPDAAAFPPLLSERDRILTALGQCRHNKTYAAEMLGIDRTTLYRKLKMYDITVKKAGSSK